MDIVVPILFSVFFGGPLILIIWAAWVRWREIRTVEPFEEVGDWGQNDVDPGLKG